MAESNLKLNASKSSDLLERREKGSQAIIFEKAVDELILADSAIVRVVDLSDDLLGQLLRVVVLAIGAQQVEHTGDDHFQLIAIQISITVAVVDGEGVVELVVQVTSRCKGIRDL